MCSTGCFAKYGSAELDALISCTVEKNDCVHIPGKESSADWTPDRLADLPSAPLSAFDISYLDGGWYKIMGLDSRYDCFDCQYNSFQKTGVGTLAMEAQFRVPRPTPPGYLQSSIHEVLHPPPTASIQASKPNDVNVLASAEPEKESAVSPAGLARGCDFSRPSTTVQAVQAAPPPTQHAAAQSNSPNAVPHLQSQGHMFGLTFWENWYILGQTSESASHSSGLPLLAHASETDTAKDMKLVYYTGHTLQGSYRGAFVYARNPEMTQANIAAAKRLITSAGLAPESFCMIRNACFAPGTQDSASTTAASSTSDSINQRATSPRARQYVGYDTPFWLVGQRFFRATTAVATELADWFQDPAILSEWLVKQQVRIIVEQPLVST
jgi:hypothetical protein